MMIGVRGYYLDSMGAKKKNDRRIWDDAFLVVTPNGMMTWQGNVDPNGWRKGQGFGRGKGMASLNPGVWIYGTGPHKGKAAFRQCAKVTVTRDGSPPYPHTGYFGINIHPGGRNSTSSLGCQTIPADTWPSFKNFVYSALAEFKNPKRKNDWKSTVHSFPYILINETERREGNLVVG